ncbi:RagB/SusD family nutrient uptake outer membrane protein [Pedobacter sp. KBS0701]|uniref:RagB/SusD family nutrient uptake outer membrane protein n=1 Tax=Pedobacter sp. KBS0701 TaxID=2578106 RepID=UPI00110D5790|nr:RagB/SusD family nutrient uptake outer membrane protein [Pedobacter sp. KBS0701]QDW24254.1 RagB/SusD family nutrient uptake outer membrane protein [Pedobacter sp. KBS0701]
MKILYLVAIVLTMSLLSCKKFLDEKSDMKLAVPERLDDLQALLNNENLNNAVDPGAAEVSADDYFVTDADLNSLSSEQNRRLYTWEKDNLFTSVNFPNDWEYLYSLIYTANTVLENLEKIERISSNAAQYDNIKGQAYFNRARAYYNILQLWSVGYDSNTADNDLGPVIRESTDFNKASVRSSVAKGYSYVLADLLEANRLLPKLSVHALRPGRQASFGFLARVYLSMRDYRKAALYADSCIKVKAVLLDYNLISNMPAFPFTRFNAEVIYESAAAIPQILNNSRAKIVADLITQYADNDLRKVLYFKNNNNGTFGWRGSYRAGQGVFPGVTIDEQYLIRAECNARLGNLQNAVDDLNTLLIKRFKSGTYIPYTVNSLDILGVILKERRKELVMRGLRWSDLKRFNLEGANITLRRTANGINYELNPNDKRYALEIPQDIISISGIQQNPR